MTRIDPLGGLSEFSIHDDDPRLERVIPSDAIAVPGLIDIAAEMLWWSPAGHHRRGMYPDKEVMPGRGLLEGFLRLHDAPGLAIRNYAQRWGVLWLCDHGLPSSHQPEHFIGAVDFRLDKRLRPFGCRARGGYGEGARPDPRAYCWEPLSDWRHYSRKAVAILRLAEQLRRRKLGAADEWRIALERFDERPTDEGVPWWDQDVSFNKFKLSQVLNHWLELGNIRLGIVWGLSVGDNLSLRFRRPGAYGGHFPLFGAIGIQLLFAVANSHGWVCCSSCGRLYPGGKRKPRADRRHYCKNCGVRAAWRHAQEKRREKVRRASARSRH